MRFAVEIVVWLDRAYVYIKFVGCCQHHESIGDGGKAGLKITSCFFYKQYLHV